MIWRLSKEAGVVGSRGDREGEILEMIVPTKERP